jgi:hypothetical protein
MSRIRTQTGGFYYAKYQFKRSILENALQDDYTTEDYAAALAFFGGCAFCGTLEAPRKDHLVAVFQCGDFIRQNVVPACQKCDDSKGQKEYHEWMRNSNSRNSLKMRGVRAFEIERRIRKIEKWQGDYEPKNEEALFGEDYPRYLEILVKMEDLCQEAASLSLAAESRHYGTSENLQTT